MEVEPKRYHASQLPSPPTLKQPLANKKKQIYLQCDKMNFLIIDYGSENIKAGYDWSQDGPEMIFRPQISKNRDPNKVDLPVKFSINSAYQQLDLTKSNYKSVYERNIILHFGLLQQCNDYIFSQLIKPNKKIRSPLIISQPFANPTHCRSSTLEQLFQCYEIDTVMVGVDSLFAYFYQVDCNINRYEKESSLVIHMGANTIHIVCIIDGQVEKSSVRRINIGGNQAFQLFGKSLLLKNPHLKSKMTYSFLKMLYENFTSVAIDYKQQLKYFESKFKPEGNKHIYRNRIQEANKLIDENLQFIEAVQIDFEIVVEIPEEEIKRKEEVKKRMAEKLKETLQRRKQMKKKMHEIQLKNFQQLRDKYEEHDKFAHEEVVEMFGHHKPLDKLEKKIKALEIKLGIIEEKPEQNQKFSLINVPDHELPPERLKYKKLQIYQKQALENRRLRQKQKEEDQLKMKQLRDNNPELYLHQLRQKYNSMYAKMKENQRVKTELNKRKSNLKQRQMQAMARIVEEDIEEQNFGDNQDDWLALKNPDDSDHYSELDVMEAQLRQLDPEYTHDKDHHHNLKLTNQLFLLADQIRCHEIYFQPQMIGLNQMNLIDTIVSSLSTFDRPTLAKVLGNVVVVGGASTVPGLKERLERDLTRECPTGLDIKVTIGKGGALGAFLGMQNIGKYQREFIEKMSFKKEQFLNNDTIHVENPWSNPNPFK